MQEGRQTQMLLIGSAFAFSLFLTAMFVFGVPWAGENQQPIDIQQEENRTPAPRASGPVDVGQPPNETNGFATFTEVSAEVGFEYTAQFRDSGIFSRSGLYVVDFDNDGDEDMLVTGNENPVLFENTGGQFERAQEFDDIGPAAAHFFDATNNGYRDLVLAEFAGNIQFYENEGGTFRQRDVGVEQGVQAPTGITSADFTGNGCLDLFVAQNGLWAQGTPLERGHAREVLENHPDVRPETTPGNQNYLFYNQDDCTDFVEATDQAGIEGEDWSLVTSAADFTENGYPDIHVGNDFSADFLYENNGDGTFTKRNLGPKTDRNAMASVVADVNNDHHLDLFVSNIHFKDGVDAVGREVTRVAAVPEGNNLLLNQNGTGEFIDRAADSGIKEGGWGWGAAIADFTNDGHQDLIHTTSQEVPVELYDTQEPQVWMGVPGGWEQVDSEELGIDQHEGRGLSQIDFDNDGVLDFALSTTGVTPRSIKDPEPFALYENQLSDGNSLQFFVRNPDGIERNAGVYIETNSRTIFRTVNSGADFLSQNSRLFHLGTKNEQIQSVRILWPDGTESVYDDLEEGNRYILRPDQKELVEQLE